MKYIIFCCDVHTGGPFALLQLNRVINVLGNNSEVFFVDLILEKTFDKENQTFYINYKKKPNLNIQSLPFDLCSEIHIDDNLVFPEIFPDLLVEFSRLGFKKRIFWWLSWDNAPIGNLNKLSYSYFLNSSKHIFQSYYAQYEAKRFGFKGPIISDYTIYNPLKIKKISKKSIDICYLTRKAEGAEELIIFLKNNFKVQEIDGLDHEGVQDVLMNSKVFIDFGNLPGKDRIPREAILYDCIPILRNIGSGKFSEDFEIPNILKLDLDTISDPNLLSKKIIYLNKNRELILKQLSIFKKKVKNEFDLFYYQVREKFLKIFN